MFYIFHGPDEFSAKEALTRRTNSLGDAGIVDLNLTELDGKSLTLSELTNYAQAIPFLAPRRLVVVYNYLARLGGSGRSKGDTKAIEALLELLNALPATTELIFVEETELKQSHPVLKLGLGLDNCVHAFNNPDKYRLPGWIENRVKRKGGQIEPPAVTALANVVGDDLRALDNEIEKLTLYVNDRRPISLADVELLCPYTADSETFAMANAIGRRDLTTALDQLHKRLQEGQNALAIMGGITSQFRSLLEVKSMAAAGLNPAQIAREKGWRSDYAAKMRLQEARNFSLERLAEIFNILLQTDLEVKTGQIDETLALDTLVSRLCSAR